ncbi:NDP-hexose 2,3-dehydratase family protein [[Clostridium] innocuum]|uniref:NDP-hexose 2,3-dehydratase family protein n=1 Tax=Clostridium innocuum TaxID=1522 RepID=UPI001E2ED88A|nr:NDP-hexose 2,3-dehydratase family protein [[Clostridium] innocuum]MCC2831415.1 NDP-hexose 2,3-dehydratase family protein [[Clostridium] innocuum]MCR0245246.1 NDP-hexose 2,3-dehydratase family protein [[Clostridium] innocuum]MCR0258592.1 NDP-hexose 2,3-dehydratase family protein [[Clostridium] innocuum]MCR0503243.1 NDP-hexose 2,3-dehydratase family protein [[Clostridium] innocuum]
MTQAYHRKCGTDTELVEVLTAISQVSARMARNLRILAATGQSEEGGRYHEQNERYGHDHRRTTQCSCRY